MSDTSHYRWIAVAAAAGLVAGAGYVVYKYVIADEDAEEEVATPVLPKTLPANKQPVARRDTPKRTSPKAATPTKVADPASNKKNLPFNPLGKANSSGPPGGPKICALCKKPAPGLPLRCSQCKSTYYCSQECQKKAWPDHKVQCGKGPKPPRSAAEASTSADGSSEPAEVGQQVDGAQQVEGVSNPADPAAVHSPASSEPASSESSTTAAPGTPDPMAKPALPKPDVSTTAEDVAESSAESGGHKPLSMQDAMAEYLRQAASERAGTLDGAFEESIMHFLQGDHRTALTKFQKVQSDSKAQNRPDMEGEMYKWIGHCHNRLSDTKNAEKAFEAGCKFGEMNGLPKLAIECLSGLGCMYRAQNETDKAVDYLSRALDRSQAINDDDSKASVLCNLGAAMMTSQPDEGLMCLQMAVKLREDAIEAMHEAGERSGLATAVMEHAGALVNLAGALYATKRLDQAKLAYEQALDVFELIEDTDKTSKVLVNLHNMAEVQMQDADLALQYRTKLVAFLSHHHLRTPEDTCTICLEPLKMGEATKGAGAALLILSCLHCHHDACFKKWCEGEVGSKQPVCPTCKAPVPLFD